MLIYAMDSDFYTLQEIQKEIYKYETKSNLKLFTNVTAMWENFQKEPPDLAIIEYEAYDSVTLLKKIKDSNPVQKIILCCKTKNIIPEVVNLQLFGIIEKPITGEKLKEQLLRLKHPLLAKLRIKKGWQRDE